ncbi:MAG TPA: HD domain-containing phosphohydrolase [Planctomycetota bacterium]|nr:HD domain-containing phosphohydrolase [Planctomycetota bacterium]
MSDTTEIRKTESRLFKPLKGTRLTAVPDSASLQERVLALEEEASKLALLLEMSQVLSSEKELDAVMGLIVAHTTRIMNCERSSVFLLDKKTNELFSLVAQGLDTKELRFSVKTGIAGYVASNGVGLNVPDAYKDPRFNTAVDKATGYRTVSVLCMPLHDRRGDTLGVLQCLNHKGPGDKPIPFTVKDEVVLSAVAAQAAVYLDNMNLRRQMDILFESFVEATSRSIDDRDPCTSGHSRRVMSYSLNLARAVHACQKPPFTDIVYTRDRVRQLRYACLLHDVGKIGVREYILCKAAKLSAPAMDYLRERFKTMRERSRAESLVAAITQKMDVDAALAQFHAPLCAELDQALAVIEKANAANFMSDAEIDSIKAIKARGWITDDEFKNLSVRKGNLTEAEWDDMRSHVTKSFRMLIQIPWPSELKDLPEVAYTHHEKYDGSGYPRKLKKDEIHLDGQIMCVADIYDALTASDRPYKKAIPHERAEHILREEEAAKGRIIPELVDLFFTEKCYIISEHLSKTIILKNEPK